MPDIQDRFMEKARELADDIDARALWSDPQGSHCMDHDVATSIIALALQEQHEAGRREEREECAKLADGFNGYPAPAGDGMGTHILREVYGRDVGAAIRSRT